eukprot:TRINITY_DN5353_c0_g1_i2.p1 TRINITY_DN5353_c0_g1~~TRINITY_DN5353_c0_g1_i2.p1  ORF type:complete len:985 (-),score=158.24 TRINITY_DN5353_c0_g1_i2:747-3701(-)
MGNRQVGRVIDPSDLKQTQLVKRTADVSFHRAIHKKHTVFIECIHNKQLVKKLPLSQVHEGISRISNRKLSREVALFDAFVSNGELHIAYKTEWFNWTPLLESLPLLQKSTPISKERIHHAINLVRDYISLLQDYSKRGFDDLWITPGVLFVHDNTLYAVKIGLQPLLCSEDFSIWSPPEFTTNRALYDLNTSTIQKSVFDSAHSYLIGTLLWSLIYSTQPSAESRTLSLKDSSLHESLPGQISNLPIALQQIIKACCQKDPVLRPTLKMLGLVLGWIASTNQLIDKLDLSRVLLGPLPLLSSLENVVEAAARMKGVSVYVSHALLKQNLTVEQFLGQNHTNWDSIPHIQTFDYEILRETQLFLSNGQDAISLVTLVATGLNFKVEDYVSRLKELEMTQLSEVFFYLGRCAHAGIGMERNNQLAISLFRKCLTAKNPCFFNLEDFDKSPQDNVHDASAAFSKGHLLRTQGLLILSYSKNPEFLSPLIILRQIYLQHSQLLPQPADEDSSDFILELVKRSDPEHLKRSFEWVQTCPLDDPFYNYQLAYLYYRGWGVERDFEKSFKMIEKSAVSGFVMAQNNLAYCYLEGEGVEKNKSMALAWWLVCGSLGHAGGQDNLGYHYKNVYEGEDGMEHATLWCRMSAAQQYPNAWNNIAMIYEKGLGCEVDLTKSFEAYEIAARMGYSWGQNNLATCYYSGAGVEKNPDLCFYWHMMAAKQDNTEAYVNVGLCYYQGCGVEKCLQTALKWYQRAAEKDNTSGIVNIGHLHFNGTLFPQSYEKALRLYHRAADLGSEDAMQQIAYCFERGLGVEESTEKAMEWYQKGLDKGCSASGYSLANLLSNKPEDERDVKRIFELYLQSANRGHVDAYRHVGLCYENGKGVEQSYENAIIWYRKGIEEKNTLCMLGLGFCYMEGSGVDMSMDEAVHWFNEAAELDDAIGQCLMGMFYREGVGVPMNLKLSCLNYFKSAEGGNENAILHLQSHGEQL